jgi:hypothetical protein
MYDRHLIELLLLNRLRESTRHPEQYAIRNSQRQYKEYQTTQFLSPISCHFNNENFAEFLPPPKGLVDKGKKHGIPGDRYISLSLRATVGRRSRH